MKKYWLIFLTTVSLTACERSIDSFALRIEPVFARITQLPETGQVSKPLRINLRVQEPNPCYQDMSLLLEKESEFTYRLQANSGYVNHNHACSQVVVVTDTAITFVPPQKGTYVIHTNKPPLPVQTDSIRVE